MVRAGVEDPQALLSEFLASNLLQRRGDRAALTTLGIRTLVLVDALDGADLRDTYRRLSHYDSSLRMYALLREGMTYEFLRRINDRPGFRRLYFCSPWVGLDARQERMLAHAVFREEQRGGCPEVVVMTRPSDGEEGGRGLGIFRQLNATIYVNPRLHTKLYIREPGASGGLPMAIVGSQNLTRARYLELGIQINGDGVMVDHLITYFWELCSGSAEE